NVRLHSCHSQRRLCSYAAGYDIARICGEFFNPESAVRVLLIEDDPGVAGFVKKGLREAAFAVDAVANGIEGFDLASSGAYDVIALDLMLPGRDGFSIIRGLRERDIATPVICLTARDTVDDRVRGLDVGADDYLSKPFSFSELLARIRALMRRGTAMAA